MMVRKPLSSSFAHHPYPVMRTRRIAPPGIAHIARPLPPSKMLPSSSTATVNMPCRSKRVAGQMLDFRGARNRRLNKPRCAVEQGGAAKRGSGGAANAGVVKPSNQHGRNAVASTTTAPSGASPQTPGPSLSGRWRWPTRPDGHCHAKRERSRAFLLNAPRVCRCPASLLLYGIATLRVHRTGHPAVGLPTP